MAERRVLNAYMFKKVKQALSDFASEGDEGGDEKTIIRLMMESMIVGVEIAEQQHAARPSA